MELLLSDHPIERLLLLYGQKIYAVFFHSMFIRYPFGRFPLSYGQSISDNRATSQKGGLQYIYMKASMQVEKYDTQSEEKVTL